MASNWLPGRRLARRPDPDATIQLATRWIERSLTRKQEYSNRLQNLPSRLIDVIQGDGSMVYLRDFSKTAVHGVSPKGSYICLSHRWDSTTAQQATTVENILTRMEGIPTSSLSQTFRDAIYITRRLGLQYIWIDCLCIVQDSVEDWEDESANMGTYYASSWLTIGVGVGDSKGCFGEREVTSERLQYYRMALGSQDQWILYFTQGPTTSNSSLGDDQKSILRERAWAFQEEVLSPRYLGFQRNLMFYRCGDYIEFEDGFLEWLYAPHPNRCRDGQALQKSDILDQDWIGFVESYSGRALTKDEDKLPALSGIAHQYQKVTSDQYLAGLWRKDLLRQLCWGKAHAVGPCIRPSRYRAPTWSWASINGRATFSDLGKGSSSKFVVEVQHVSVDPIGLDPLGGVKSGSLKLVGVIRKGIRSWSQPLNEPSDPRPRSGDKIHESTFLLLHTDGNIDRKTVYSFIPDTTDFPDSIRELWFLNITSRVGLALLPKLSSGLPWSADTYERVGLIEIYQPIMSIKKVAMSLDKNIHRSLVTVV